VSKNLEITSNPTVISVNALTAPTLRSFTIRPHRLDTPFVKGGISVANSLVTAILRVLKTQRKFRFRSREEICASKDEDSRAGSGSGSRGRECLWAAISAHGASISDIHGAFQSGRLTCRGLVQQYLGRIKAYDQQGPAINAMLYVNPKALEEADAMDKAFNQGAKLKPLQCIPLVLKDLFDTADMPTTGGSLALKGMQPAEDAFTVVRLRQAGALIIGKTNLHELAITGITVSSLGGQTKNPYELTRTPGGSSGGTGAALAANFAAVGTGSDTVNSIRSPSSANSLVGIRPTRGLISRAGVTPCSFTQDAVGPITRTVADAAVVLDVMAGYDPDDPVTALGVGSFSTALP
jgi:amidase